VVNLTPAVTVSQNRNFSGLLLPGSEDKVFVVIQPFVLGEVATMLWLVIMGAKEKRSGRTFIQPDQS
jgi:hypothetical protein